MYSENYKTFLEQLKEDMNEWKNILYLWIVKLNIAKMSVLSRAISRFSAIPIKRHRCIEQFFGLCEGGGGGDGLGEWEKKKRFEWLFFLTKV